MTKSSISNEKKCYICGRPTNLERHHMLFGSANRKKAEEDGLWVWLCHDCHYGIHNGNNFAKESLQKKAQAKWEENGSRDEFISRYGRSYL